MLLNAVFSNIAALDTESNNPVYPSITFLAYLLQNGYIQTRLKSRLITSHMVLCNGAIIDIIIDTNND